MTRRRWNNRRTKTEIFFTDLLFLISQHASKSQLFGLYFKSSFVGQDEKYIPFRRIHFREKWELITNFKMTTILLFQLPKKRNNYLSQIKELRWFTWKTETDKVRDLCCCFFLFSMLFPKLLRSKVQNRHCKFFGLKSLQLSNKHTQTKSSNYNQHRGLHLRHK